jgi:hypothetical protein
MATNKGISATSSTRVAVWWEFGMDEKMPESLEPFLSRDQWIVFVDEVNRSSRVGAQLGDCASAMSEILDVIPSLLNFLLLSNDPFAPDEAFFRLFIGGMTVYAVFIFVLMALRVASQSGSTWWWPGRLRAIAERTAALWSPNISTVQFLVESVPNDVLTLHFFEFSHPLLQPTKQLEKVVNQQQHNIASIEVLWWGASGLFVGGGIVDDDRKRPVALAPFVSNEQWVAFVDEVDRATDAVEHVYYRIEKIKSRVSSIVHLLMFLLMFLAIYFVYQCVFDTFVSLLSRTRYARFIFAVIFLCLALPMLVRLACQIVWHRRLHRWQGHLRAIVDRQLPLVVLSSSNIFIRFRQGHRSDSWSTYVMEFVHHGNTR